jgi:hypothetical protein
MDQFIAAIGQCDVVLDSVGWSGGNSTLEGLAVDTPIVTHRGPMMRGRHTMAILQMMGVTETIAETVDDYVAIAARLGCDPAWRAAMKRRVSESKHRVYRDSTAILALEDFFSSAACGAQPATEIQASESKDRVAPQAAPFLVARDSVASNATQRKTLMSHKSELVFVDKAVSDLDTILGNLRQGVEAIVLDDARPAAQQIAAALQDRGEVRRGLDAIHVIAHGEPGRIKFASGEWSAETLKNEPENFAAIGRALSQEGELRLWS